MKKFSKVISIMMVAIMCFAMTAVYATNIKIEPYELPGGSDIAGKILGAMQWIGILIGVGMLIYVGIKYIMGSADEKASMKGALIKYVIGAVLIMGAPTIANAIFSIMSSGN